jgi:hypothetical protein
MFSSKEFSLIEEGGGSISLHFAEGERERDRVVVFLLLY